MLGRNFKAVILDLDEVVTQNKEVHLRAWEIVFDEYLSHNEKIDLDLKKDFSNYIENNPKEDTVKDFLDLKKLALPEGTVDSKETNTMNGLINNGNRIFIDLLEQEGLHTFQDTINQMKRWKNRGLKIAVISSEKNVNKLISLAGVEELFDLLVDRTVVDELNITKPSVEAYSYICNQLSVDPEETVLIDNSPDGIKAGREFNFGLIVGMVRDSKPKRELLQNGADIIVGNMEDLKSIGLKKYYNYEIR